MYDFSIINTTSHYFNESKKRLCSDIKNYEEIITKIRNQAMENYQYSKEQQNEKLQKGEQKEKTRILLVDDEHDTCIAYQIVLQESGFECISYTDSVKALQEFKPGYYDLVILDIKMPKLDGFALCEKIREIDESIPIIFITAAEQYYENFRKRYYPNLSNDVNVNCLQKPIGNQELMQIVNMTIATKDRN